MPGAVTLLLCVHNACISLCTTHMGAIIFPPTGIGSSINI